MRSFVQGILFTTLLSGCAGTIQHNLKRESARAMIPTPYPDSVVISNIKRDRLGNPRQWIATTPTGVYDCSIEAHEEHPLCAKR